MTRMLKIHIFKAIVWYIAIMLIPEASNDFVFALLFVLCTWRMVWHLHFLIPSFK